MAKSVLQKDKECFLCPSLQNLEQHHIFGGANRKWSEKYGLKVWLCPRCHRDQKQGVHGNKEIMEIMNRTGQQAFEKTHTREDFMKIFGRNYL